MTDMTAPSSSDRASGERVVDGPIVRAWLWLIAALILLLVLVGGATRLTDSGLSITEWKPVHGVIPPMTIAEWQEEFEKYRQIPEYQLINKGMSLDEFKAIFWWEWGHRLLGRATGFAVLIPFGFFLVRRQLSGWLVPRLAGLFVSGGLQGVVGWWMVASGLSERTDVSQYRLAVHLSLACALFAYTIWLVRQLGHHRRLIPSSAIYWQSRAIVALLFLQIFLGALVAGLDAGLAFNTWPLMDGAIIPVNMFMLEPWWLNMFETVKTVQFDHRMMAYLLTAVIAWHTWSVLRSGASRALSLQALTLIGVCIVQVALGILTLLHMVPITSALAHQVVAVVLLGIAVVHVETVRSPQRS